MRSHATWCAAIGVFASALLTGVLSAGTLEVRVLEDHTGNPLANAEVSVARAGAGNLAADLETDKSGLMRVDGLAAGGYSLEVSKALYVTVKTNVRTADDTTALTVRLIRYAVVTGRVTGPGGGPTRNAVVRVLERPGADDPLRPIGGGQAVDENGEYRFFDLRPGQYAIAVSYGSDLLSPSRRRFGVQYYPDNTNTRIFTVAGGEELRGVDFFFGAGPLYRVSGTVEPFNPGASARLTVVPSLQPSWRRDAPGLTRTTVSSVLRGCRQVLTMCTVSPPCRGPPASLGEPALRSPGRTLTALWSVRWNAAR